eukprot:g5702.t1
MGVCQSKKAILDTTRPTLPDDVSIIFVLGGPGSGKGTQCEQIVKKYGCTHISAGDLLREEVNSGSPLGKQCAKLMQEGKLVPVETTLALLEKAMTRSDKKAFLIDGFPRSIEQATKFENEIKPCTTVLFFDCSKATMTARILERGKTSGRMDDTEETIKKRLDTFTNMSAPVAYRYEAQGKCHRISAEDAPEQVFKEVQRILDKYLKPQKKEPKEETSEAQPPVTQEKPEEQKEILQTTEVTNNEEEKGANETPKPVENEVESENPVEETTPAEDEEKAIEDTQKHERKLVVLNYDQEDEFKATFEANWTPKGWQIEWKNWNEGDREETESALLSANAVLWTPQRAVDEDSALEAVLGKAKDNGVVLLPSLEAVTATRDADFVNKVIGSEITPNTEELQEIEVLLLFDTPLEVVTGATTDEDKASGEKKRYKADDADFAPLLAQFAGSDLTKIQSILGDALPPLWSVLYRASPKTNGESEDITHEFTFAGSDWKSAELSKNLPLVEMLSTKLLELLSVA